VGPASGFGGGVYREPTIGWAWYGRGFGWTENRFTNGGVTRAFAWEDKSVHFNGLDPAQAPRWASGPALNSSVSDGETYVWTTDPARIGVSRGSQRDFYDCPNYPKADRCEALWAQHADPVIERIKAFIAQNEPKANARQQQVQTLLAQWQQKVGPELVARGAAIAQQLNDQTAAGLAQHQRCLDLQMAAYADWNKQNQGTRPRQAAMRTERLAKTLKELWSGECASHPDAVQGLKNAEESFQSARNLWVIHEQGEQYQAERAQRRRENFGAIVDGVATFQATKSALEQEQAAQAQAEAQADAQARAQAQAQRETSASTYQSRPAQGGLPAPVQTATITPPQPGSTSADRRAQQQREVDQSNLDNKRRAEDLAARNAHASNCVEPVQQPGAFGAFRNKCGYPVNYVFCTLGSTGEGLTNFSDAFDCRKPSPFGMDSIAPHGVQGSSIAGAPQVLWGACKHPFYPGDKRYNGREIIFSCRK
jgi:hypothetical protein